MHMLMHEEGPSQQKLTSCLHGLLGDNLHLFKIIQARPIIAWLGCWPWDFYMGQA